MAMSAFGEQWRREGGHGEVLKIAIPLILTTGFHTVQHFVDRMFLAWYSSDALAAALAASMVYYTLASVFLGTVGYVNTFVAQYVGSGRPQRVGAALWQGLYLGLLSTLLIGGISLFADAIFEAAGHEPNIRALEIQYFRILCWGVFFALVMSAVSCFYTGRGKTWTILWVNAFATVVNIVLDYAWIFGRWGFPEMGIQGAAWATVAAQGIGAVLLCALIWSRNNRVAFATLRAWRPEADLFLRLLRYGLPSGFQFFVEMIGYTAVVLLIGRVGSAELGATSAAFNINMLAFLPPIGLSIAVSTLVGQRLGQNRPDLAERSTWSAFHMAFLYIATIALLYVLIPRVFLWPFKTHADPTEFAMVEHITVVLLRFIALYCVFDAMMIIFTGALRGAGDTRFVMWSAGAMSLTIMVIPAWIALQVFGAGVYVLWAIMTAYVMVMGVVFLTRFKGGKWKTMCVTEPVPPELEYMEDRLSSSENPVAAADADSER